MTPDQYRREGAEAMREAAAEAAYKWRDDDEAQELREHVRAIDVDEVLANGWSVTCNGCGWLGDEEGLIGTLDADDGEPCRACPTCGTDGNLMDTQPAAPDLHVTTPDAVARLVEAARAFASWDHCWPGNINLDAACRDIRVALTTMETNHD